MNQCHHGGLDPVCAIRDVLSSGQNPMLKTGDAATHMIVLWLSSEALRVWKVVLLESESGERLCALIVLHAELRSSREASPSGRCGAVGGRWRVRSWRYSLNVSCHRKTLLFLMFFFFLLCRLWISSLKKRGRCSALQRLPGLVRSCWLHGFCF